MMKGMDKMKKGFISLLLCILLITSFASPACANSWGLKGDLLDAVSDVDTWNDYNTLDSQVGDAALMHSRYHNTLMLVEDGRLRTFPTSVYQPDDKRDDELILNGGKKDFVLNYGDDEWYSFNNLGSGWYLVGTLTDTSGCVGYTESPSSTITRGYNASDTTGSAVIPYGIPLRDFNIQLFPRTVQEIRHLNLMHAALDSGADILGWWADDEDVGQKKSNAGKGTTPVYSAPFGKSAWRAAKGKASVGLSGDLWVLRYVTNADGERYACIRYGVSERTQRIGYIPAEVLGEEAQGEPSEDFIHVPVYASRETYLTDDPLCSQFPQFKVPAGTQFECLGMFNRWYAYVAAEVKDGRFVDGGEIVWGFVPLRDLALDADTHGNILWDVMAELEGSWEFYAGGNQAEDILILNADGTYTGKWVQGDEIYPDNHGAWFVTEYNPSWNLYWNDPPYEITLVDEDGTVNVKGLSIDEEGFSLTYWEGGGGYRRMEEEIPSEPDIKIVGSLSEAAIPSEEMAADFFPGYTFHTYQTFNYNTIASATYYKLENNVLYIRRVRFGEEHEPLIQDCMPLPLDPVLCEQLPSTPFDSLLCLDGSSSLFQTENGIDTARIPIEDIILQSELHTDTLVLLTKDANDQRRIQLVSQNDQGQYDIRVSEVLPESTTLDILHAGEGELYVQWESGKRLAAFSRSDGGNWKLTGIQNGHYDDDFSVEYFGAYCASESGWGLVDGAVFGSLGNTDLLEIDLNTLPRNKEELRSMIDRTGWAAVYSHDEEDRAVLYCAPESNAEAYAEFYNGTPVQIKE